MSSKNTTITEYSIKKKKGISQNVKAKVKPEVIKKEYFHEGLESLANHFDEKKRCWNCISGELSINYHDEIWGKASTDSKDLFGQLILQIFQSGLSWKCVLQRSETMKEAFDNWDYEKIAKYSEKKVQSLLENKGIIRNERKVRATVTNAKIAVALDKKYKKSENGTSGFAQFIWKHGLTLEKSERLIVGAFPSNHMRTDFDTKAKDRINADGVHPTKNVELFVKALNNEGFKHIGPTTMLSYLQASGLCNHHKQSCFVFDRNEKIFTECSKMMNKVIEKIYKLGK